MQNAELAVLVCLAVVAPLFVAGLYLWPPENGSEESEFDLDDKRRWL